MFDDKGYYANKTLAEVRKSKAEDSLDHGMKAAEHVYRFMGAVDEMFKEIVISSEMATHAKCWHLRRRADEAGAAGQGLQCRLQGVSC